MSSLLSPYAVTPKDYLPNHIWHMDVTHVPYSRKLKYDHVMEDTQSLLSFALPLSAEAVKDAISFLNRAFAVLGPREIL